ncbi:MAG: hypothetical protein A2792_11490 [Sphingomonadales bacterium RIFCSPHIGHO2_01_FULL_65_20]|jgi:hypothetical protein|uniref:hypothetical protein n=1 Tax=unclassified Blastomonas TaxID=2626550 RepID=UPI0008D4FCD2|nr:hypothetical protein [Blastomonas sp.]MCH2239178.1 hypothetical protein [Blastomonas sp.]OHC92987.1 MAG: hypothetical protein A2792_11490 [Sphingomonadales bacterium RIFCSPHIGHO2_01_FULL_65_20]
MNITTAHNARFTPRQIAWSAAAALLVAPAIAMLFTREVNWGAEDFVAFALLIGVGGLAGELAVRFARKPVNRAILIAAIALAFLLVWAELAVGILPG